MQLNIHSVHANVFYINRMFLFGGMCQYISNFSFASLTEVVLNWSEHAMQFAVIFIYTGSTFTSGYDVSILMGNIAYLICARMYFLSFA